MAEYRINTVFAGKYHIVRLLGHGGMGTVYEAKHIHTDASVALKILREDAHDPNAATRMLREARALAKLDHPHIVRLLDADVINGELCLVQELVEGQTLRQKLDAQLVCTPEETLEIIVPIVSALQSAHRQGIIHRDIKPDNIILSSKNAKPWPKLVDFGIALSVHEDRQTRQGSMVGTPHYMSPEQAWGKLDVTASTDVWSVAMVAYECLAGSLAYDGPNERAVLAQIVAEEPIHLTHAAMSIDDALADLVMRCLVKKPEARIASMSELLEGILSLHAFEKEPWFISLVQRFGPSSRQDVEVKSQATPQQAPSTAKPKEPNSVKEPSVTRPLDQPTQRDRPMAFGSIAAVSALVLATVWMASQFSHAQRDVSPPRWVALADASVPEVERSTPLVQLVSQDAVEPMVLPSDVSTHTEVISAHTEPAQAVAHAFGHQRVGPAAQTTIPDSGARPRVQSPASTLRGTNGAPIVEDL